MSGRFRVLLAAQPDLVTPVLPVVQPAITRQLQASGAMAPALALCHEARDLASAPAADFALVAALHGLAETHRAMGDPAAACCSHEVAIMP